MGRPKIHDYEQTAFARSISALQKEHGYTDEYVIEHIVDDLGICLINDIQTYGSYKSGKRKSPRDFPDILKAFSKFYNVTTDYLLELDDTPNHQVKAVKDATGLSDIAAKNLMAFNSKHPEILEMIDILLCASSKDDDTFFINLYNQIYNDYKDAKSGNTASNYDIQKMEHRFLLMQQMYNYISTTVSHGLSTTFDKRLLTDEDANNYYHSPEYVESIPDIENCDYDLEYEDGTIKHLRAERYR